MRKNSKAVIIRKILNHYMGAYDFLSGTSKNKTLPVIRKIEKSSKTAVELVDAFLDSRVASASVIFSETSEKWDPVCEPLVVFLSHRTHWQFWQEGFNDYIIRTEGDSTTQCSVLFSEKKLSEQDRERIKKWLLA